MYVFFIDFDECLLNKYFDGRLNRVILLNLRG